MIHNYRNPCFSVEAYYHEDTSMFTALCTLAYLTIYNNVGIKIIITYHIVHVPCYAAPRQKSQKADGSEAQEEKTEKGKR